MYKKLEQLLRIDFVRFCIVGTLGFLINLVILTVLYKVLNLPLIISQIIASEIALFSNFMLHHKWTYRASNVRKTISKLIIQFHITSWIAVVGSTVMVTVGVTIFKLDSSVSLVIASSIALFWNFVWSRYGIWRKEKTPTKIDEVEREV